jgi:hypothetical protein
MSRTRVMDEENAALWMRRSAPDLEQTIPILART